MNKDSFFPVKHFQAVLIRRLIIIKRSWKSLLFSLISGVILGGLVIGVYWLMASLMKSKGYTTNFGSYKTQRPDFIFLGDSSPMMNYIAPTLIKMHDNEVNTKGVAHYYENVDKVNEELFTNASNSHFPMSIPFGINFIQSNTAPYEVSLLYNSTPNEEIESAFDLEMNMYTNLNRALWKQEFGDDAEITLIDHPLNQQLMQIIFGSIGPMLILCGLLTLVPSLVQQPSNDVNGEIRSYMQSCTLKIFPYWVATFIVDLAVWLAIVTILWIVFNIGMIDSFHDNLFNIWYALAMTGPSFILFLYAVTFAFSNPQSAPRQIFMILLLTLFVPMLVSVLRQKANPVPLDWIYSLFPHLSLQQLLTYMLGNVGSDKQNLTYYFKDKNSQPLVIMQIVDIFLYIIIITIVEASRIFVQRKLAKMNFSNYSDFFKKAKAKHHVSDEALIMENAVHSSHDYAVRVENVSRLFVNTAGEPIPAVNNVSLGVNEGSLFGFLGANGAGKTTLIRMITGLLSPSYGSIEIFGKPIEEIADKTVLSICPQFNNHLCNELTAKEHFKIYSLLFQFNEEDTNEVCDRLINILDLKGMENVPIRELSAGDVRKLAIALSFLGPAKIVLLDEPTASLDPVACHHVHEMITQNKGSKTFMLCTHLLSEAESLCDMISIMVKGNVYTVGSPQYLTAKFGTEFKIDVMLDDESEECSLKCDTFFAEYIPMAELTIKRPTARIYSIPANVITLPTLFQIMQEGSENRETSGFSYYTCSSSSLERVFMEIVRMSEMNDNENSNEHIRNTADEKKEKEDEGNINNINDNCQITTIEDNRDFNIEKSKTSSKNTSEKNSLSESEESSTSDTGSYSA
ncbi:ABC transporter family protein [Tritrichomonas foetus]|uniref:ABC transporter family protein n=1 Tax=Tritrichomonas foetus TaxID=1144522 RepID=A0A1J4K9S5_9EUKA|nr:ABC transporter family protein [Tritrichomonas foetus]|eukprot:OHT07698.1 ABC transporter family protein [Tritrichomonas foetus]